MQLRCPECRRLLRVSDAIGEHPVRCPACGAVFRVGQDVSPIDAPRPRAKQIFLALDVSTSVGRFLPSMHRHLRASLDKVRRGGEFELAVYLFHRHVMPFPTRQLCRPRPFEEALVPTLEEMQQRVSGGTALLDTLDHLITDAGEAEGVDRRVIIYTDGWERGSRRATVEGLREKIAQRGWLSVSLAGFVDVAAYGRLADMAGKLGLPDHAWSFSIHQGDEASIHDSIHGSSLSFIQFASQPSIFNPPSCELS